MFGAGEMDLWVFCCEEDYILKTFKMITLKTFTT